MESENTSENKFNISIGRPLRTRGDQTEALAIQWLKNQGVETVAWRFKTPFAEVDLILHDRKKNDWFVGEVKSSLWPDERAVGLTFRQRARLTRASQWLQSEIAGILGSEVSLSIVLIVREDLPMRRVGFQILPMF